MVKSFVWLTRHKHILFMLILALLFALIYWMDLLSYMNGEPTASQSGAAGVTQHTTAVHLTPIPPIQPENPKLTLPADDVNPEASPCAALVLPAEKSISAWIKFDHAAKQQLIDGHSPLVIAMNKAIASDDLRVKAAALHMRLQILAMKYQLDEMTGGACGLTLACQELRENERQHGQLEASNEIAKLAIYSSDNQVYALAFHICKTSKNQNNGYCQQISAGQWISRDPNNAVPWLYQLEELESLNHGTSHAQIDAALYRISTATSLDFGLASIVDFQNSEKMKLGDSYARFRLRWSVGQLQEQFPRPDLNRLINACQGDALLQPDWLRVCESIAAKFLGDESDIVLMNIAKKIGENISWSKQKMLAIQQEIDALSRLAYANAKSSLVDKNVSMRALLVDQCDRDWNSVKLVENMMRQGQLGALRLDLARNHKQNH